MKYKIYLSVKVNQAYWHHSAVMSYYSVQLYFSKIQLLTNSNHLSTKRISVNVEYVINLVNVEYIINLVNVKYVIDLVNVKYGIDLVNER